MQCKLFEPGNLLGPHFLNSQRESVFWACKVIRARTACRAEFRGSWSQLELLNSSNKKAVTPSSTVHACSLFIYSPSPRRLVSAPVSHRWIFLHQQTWFEDCPQKGCDIFPDILSYFVFIDWLCFHNSTFLSSWWDRLHIAPLQLSKEHGWRRTKRFSYSWAGKHILKRAQLLLHGFYQDLTSLYAHTVVAILLYFEYHLEIP